MSRGTNGEMQSQHFKLFLSYILDNSAKYVIQIFIIQYFNFLGLNNVIVLLLICFFRHSCNFNVVSTKNCEIGV